MVNVIFLINETLNLKTSQKYINNFSLFHIIPNPKKSFVKKITSWRKSEHIKECGDLFERK
jgi:hypothetical protein